MSINNSEEPFQNHIEINLRLDHLYFHYVQPWNVGLIRSRLFILAHYKLPEYKVEKIKDLDDYVHQIDLCCTSLYLRTLNMI